MTQYRGLEYSNRKIGQSGLIYGFFIAPKGKSCRMDTPCVAQGGFSLPLGQKEAEMQTLTRNRGQQECSDLMGIDVQKCEFRKKDIEECSTKFEQIIHQARVRLGLEAA